MSKLVRCMSVILVVMAHCALSDAADVDPSGVWRWEHRSAQGDTVNDVLKLKLKNDGTVEGTYQGNNAPIPIESGRYEDQRLRFQFPIDFNDQNVIIKFDAAVEPDDLNGNVTFDFNGESRQFPWRAKRRIKTEDLLGSWDISVAFDDDRKINPRLKISRDGDKFQGTYDGVNGRFPVTEMKAIGASFLFSVAGPTEDARPFRAIYTGKPIGSRMDGKVKYEHGDASGEFNFTATRTEDQ